MSGKGAELHHMLLLNTNKKPYMRSPIAPLHLTLGDLKGQSKYQSYSEALYLVKGLAELGLKLALKINRKPHKRKEYGVSNGTVTFDLE